jgi:DUF2959 family protein
MKASPGTPSILPLAALAALGLGLSACTATGVTRNAATTSTMEDLEEFVGKARRSLGDTLGALDEVQNTATTDPGPAFSRFGANVDEVRSTADDIPRRATALKSQAAKHDEAWLRETSSIQDGALRRKAEERREETMKKFEAIETKAFAAKASYEPVIRRLQDVLVFLSNDLNPTGISAIREQVAGIKNDADEVDKALDALAKELVEVRVAMSPRQPTPPRGH